MKRILSTVLALLLLCNPLLAVAGESWVGFASEESGLSISPGNGSVSSMILGSTKTYNFTVENTSGENLYNLTLGLKIGNGLWAVAPTSIEGVEGELTTPLASDLNWETEILFTDIKDLAADETFTASIPMESMIHAMEKVGGVWVEGEDFIAFGDEVSISAEWIAGKNPLAVPGVPGADVTQMESTLQVALTPVEVIFSGGGDLLKGAGDTYNSADNAFKKSFQVTMKNNEAVASMVGIQVQIPDGVEVSGFSEEPVGYTEAEANANTMNLLGEDGTAVLDFGIQVLSPGESKVISYDVSIFNHFFEAGEVNAGVLISHNQVLPFELNWELVEPDLDPDDPSYPTYQIQKKLIAKELILTQSVTSEDDPIGYGSQLDYTVELKSNQYYGMRDISIRSYLEGAMNDTQIGQDLIQGSILYSGEGYSTIDRKWLKGEETKEEETNPTGIVWSLGQTDTVAYLIDGLSTVEKVRDEIAKRENSFVNNDASLQNLQGMLTDESASIQGEITASKALAAQILLELDAVQEFFGSGVLMELDALIAEVTKWQESLTEAKSAGSLIQNQISGSENQLAAQVRSSAAVVSYDAAIDDLNAEIADFRTAVASSADAWITAQAAQAGWNSELADLQAAQARLTAHLSSENAMNWLMALDELIMMDPINTMEYMMVQSLMIQEHQAESERSVWVGSWSNEALTVIPSDDEKEAEIQTELGILDYKVSMDTARTGYSLDKESNFKAEFSMLVMENWVNPLDWSPIEPVLAGDSLSNHAILDMRTWEGDLRIQDSLSNVVKKIPLATIRETVVDINDDPAFETVDGMTIIQVGDVVTMQVIYDGSQIDAKQNLKEMFFILPIGTSYVAETLQAQVITGGPAPVMAYDSESDTFGMVTVEDPEDPSKRLPFQVDEGTKVTYTFDFVVEDSAVIVEGKEDFHLSKLVLETHGNVQSDRDESQFYYSAPKFTINKEAGETDLSNLKGGQVVPFTITIENESRSSAYEVVVQDQLPDQLILLPDTLQLLDVNGTPVLGGVGYDMENKLLTFSLTEVPGATDTENGMVIIAYEAGVVNPAPAELAFSNTASLVSYQKQEGEAPVYTDQPLTDKVTMTVAPFSVEKTVVDSTYRNDDPSPILDEARPGDRITYEIVIQMEPGISVYDLKLKDTLPLGMDAEHFYRLDGTDWTEITDAQQPDADNHQIYEIDMGNQGSASEPVTFTYRVVGTLRTEESYTQLQNKTNTAYVTWKTALDGEINKSKSDAASIQVVIPDVRLLSFLVDRSTKKVDNKTYATFDPEIVDTAVFTARFKNKGRDIAYNTEVRITLPEEYELDLDSIPEGLIYDAVNHRLTGTIVDLEVGETQAYPITLTSQPETVQAGTDREMKATMIKFYNEFGKRYDQERSSSIYVNQAPTATDGEFIATEDITLTGSLDRGDLNGDQLVYSVLTDLPASVGSFSFTGGNAWAFVPALNNTEDDNLIEVQVSDNLGGVATAAITIDIVAVNDAPEMSKQSFVTDEESAIENQSIAYSDVDSTGWTFVLVGDEPETGSFTLRPNGTFDYTPPTDFYGDVSFQVRVTDNGDQEDETLLSDEAIITIVVRNVQDAPELIGDTTETNEDIAVEGTVTARDSDPEDILTYAIESDPTYGTVGISKDSNGQATYRYVPALNYHGPDQFQVRVSDGKGNADLAYVNITVHPVNDPPVVDDQFYTTKEDIELTKTIPALDVDHDELKFTLLQTVSKEEGTLSLREDGSFDFDPAPDFVGDVTFQVTVSDQVNPALTDTATITIRVTPVNDPPVASNLFITIAEDTTTTGSVTASDVDGDALTYEFDEQSLENLRGTVMKTNGSSSPDFIYTPKDDDYGTESFVMIVRDPDGEEAHATITIQVTAVNDLPVTPNQQTAMDEDDEEIQGVLVVTDADPTDLLVSTLTRAPIHGRAMVATSGSWSYEPDANWHGVETFDIGTDDGQEGTAVATITVTVRSINDLPTTVDYWHTTQQNLAIPGQVVAKDADLQNLVFGGTEDELAFSVDLGALHGQVSIDEETGEWRYEPGSNYVGEDVFTVRVQDEHGGQTTSQINIQVIGQDGAIYPSDNNPPVTGNQTILVKAEDLGTILFGQVIGVDPNGDELVYELLETDGRSLEIEGIGTFRILAEGSGQWELDVDDEVDFSKLPTFVSIKISDQRGGETVARVYFAKEKLDFAMNGIVQDIESYGAVDGEEILIDGAIVRLYDAAGNELDDTVSAMDGSFDFGQQPEGIYTVVIEKEGFARKNHEFIFTGTGEEVIYISPYGLDLLALPKTLVMDGRSVADLLATLTDLDGNVVADWSIVFGSVEKDGIVYGTYLDGDSAITDENGEANTRFRAADIDSLESKIMPLIVEAKTDGQLKARDQILLIFEPSVIEGIVTDQETGEPVAGAIVRVEEDLDGDGVADYFAEFVTGVDGRYSIPIPLGNSRYDLSIEKPMKVGDTTKSFVFRQTVDVGEITGTGDRFYADRTISGILLERSPDGEEQIPTDLSQYALEVFDADGRIHGDVFAILNPDGTFTINGVQPGESYIIKPRVVYQGQTLYLPGIEVAVTEAGEILIGEVLVDPFGTVTDKSTGEVIEGAQVTLYYANTERNRSAGRPIDEALVLPDHPLALSNNENPQFSTIEGKYGYMVYPFTDYYLLLEKDGYQDFDSRDNGIISVEEEIVIYNIQMSKSGKGFVHIDGTLDMELRAVTKTPRVNAGDLAEIDLLASNLSDKTISEVVIRSALPEGISPVIEQYTDGMRIRVVDNKLVVTLYNVKPGEIVTIPIQYRTGEDEENGRAVRMDYRITPMFGIKDSDKLNAQAGFLIIRPGETGHHDRYLYGYPDETVQPERAVSRAEAVAMVVRILKLEGGASLETVFDKELEGHWARNNIVVAMDHGLIEGYLTGWFKPDQAMTRAEFSTLVARTIDLDRLGDAKAFWAENTMARLLDYGLLKGDPDGNLRPNDAITRAEAVTILNRLLMRGPLKGIEPFYTDLLEAHWAYGDLVEATYNHDFRYREEGEVAEDHDLEKPIQE